MLIFCPLCGWEPKPEDRWDCLPGCGHSWHTFSTHGQCPSCAHQWRETGCHECGEVSSHADWYHEANEEGERTPAPVREIRSLSSFGEFHELLRDKMCPHYVFRGVTRVEHDLIPRIGRKLAVPKNKAAQLRFYNQERTLLEFFRAHALPHIGIHANFSEWHWLALAQHYGVATRLLDWSENPLVALYFASLADLDADGALYLLHVDRYITAGSQSPLSNTHNGPLLAPHVTQRLAAQGGLFTVHPHPWEPYRTVRGDSILKMRITSDFKRELRLVLPRYGLSPKTLMADLDSAATEIDGVLEARQCLSGRALSAHVIP